MLKLLDLFCGGGGASVGYHRAGFDVTGVDIATQKNYPYTFIKADATTFCLDGFDVLHASPPCQRFSIMSQVRPGLSETYPDFIDIIRQRFIASGKPYIIENVPRAPLRADVTLCGHMFGLPVYRHRLFESNVPLVQPSHPKHVIPASKAGSWRPGTIMSVAGHCYPKTEVQKAMGIDWMTVHEMAEAIPPTYSEYTGKQVMEYLEGLCG